MSITWTMQGALKRSTEIERARLMTDFNQSITTDEESYFTWQVPTGTIDQEYDFGLVDDAQMLCIITDHQISVKLSDTMVDPISFSKFFVLMGTTINQLFISNNSGETATVRAFIGGRAIVTP